MTHSVSARDRLRIFAEGGVTKGFSLNIYDSTAEELRKQGIVLSNPRPADYEKQMRYDVDFSTPVPGTLSEELYNIAVAANANENS